MNTQQNIKQNGSEKISFNKIEVKNHCKYLTILKEQMNKMNNIFNAFHFCTQD